jgi:hypothetical protein
MTDNEVPLNKQQDSGQEDQELTPWLQKRLEERARPLTSQGLLQVVHHGGQLARWVIKHTSLSSLISRVGNLTFLSRASRGIARRAASVEPSDIYSILDLPWFRAGQDQSQEKIDTSGVSSFKEPSSGKVMHSPPEFPKEGKATKQGKETETYIHRLISPPLSRKTNQPIGTHPVRVQQKMEVSYSDGTEKRPEKSTANSAKRMSETPVSPITGTQKGTNAGKLETPRSYEADNAKKTASKVDGQLKDAYLEPSSQSAQQVLRAIEAAEKSTTSSVQQSRQQISPSVEFPEKSTEPDIQRSRQRQRDDSETGRASEIAESPVTASVETTVDTVIHRKFDAGKAKKEDATPTPPGKETIGKREITKKLQRDELSGARIESHGKEVSEVYPVQDLFHKKPMSIGQKIVRSLPFIRNIMRKESQPFKPATSIAEERPEIKESSAATKKIEMVHPDERASSIIQESPTVFDINITEQAKKESSSVSPELKEIIKEKPAESFKLVKQPIIREHSAEEGTRQIYPDKDLFHKRPPAIGQQIMRSLPIIGNLSRKMDLPSQPVTYINDEQRESQYSKLPLTDLETSPIREANEQQPPSPVVKRIITGKPPAIGRKEIPTGGNLEALPDFTGAVRTSELDLVLAPMKQTSLAHQQDNHVEAGDETQNIQRALMPSVSQPIIQTQPEPVQQPSTTQTTIMRAADTNAVPGNNQIDYKTLAREIYPLIRRMIAIERERRPSR